jgi:hypothetical protein
MRKEAVSKGREKRFLETVFLVLVQIYEENHGW